MKIVRIAFCGTATGDEVFIRSLECPKSHTYLMAQKRLYAKMSKRYALVVVLHA